MKDQVWLTLAPDTGSGGVQVAVDRAEALTWTAADFAKLYRGTVCGASKREALEWGEGQVRERDLALNA